MQPIQTATSRALKSTQIPISFPVLALPLPSEMDWRVTRALGTRLPFGQNFTRAHTQITLVIDGQLFCRPIKKGEALETSLPRRSSHSWSSRLPPLIPGSIPGHRDGFRVICGLHILFITRSPRGVSLYSGFSQPTNKNIFKFQSEL